MTATRVKLMSGTVQETMLLCFLDRATYCRSFPDLLSDPVAEEILKQHEADVAARTFRKSEMAALSILVRSRNFDLAAKRYIEEHPDASVVNLAAGLETNFSRVDNGRIRWFDLDLPDAIEFRTQFIPETERSRCLKSNLLDYRWMEQVEFDKTRGIFFVASGIFCYLDEEELYRLLAEMARRFPGGEIVFESYSRPTIAGNNFFLKSRGIDARLKYTPPPHQRTLSRWSSRLQLVERFPYYSRLPGSVPMKTSTWLLMKASDLLWLLYFARVRFLDSGLH